MSDPTKTAAADAAANAAAYGARTTYARGFEDGAKHVDEVGIQLAAAQERLRLATSTIDKLRPYAIDTFTAGLLRAWDAVPGDVLDTTGARWVGPDGEPER